MKKFNLIDVLSIFYFVWLMIIIINKPEISSDSYLSYLIQINFYSTGLLICVVGSIIYDAIKINNLKN